MPSKSCALVQKTLQAAVSEYGGVRITTHDRLVSHLSSELADHGVSRSAIERWTVGLSHGSGGRLRSMGLTVDDNGDLVPCTSNLGGLDGRRTSMVMVYFGDQFDDAQCAIRAGLLQEMSPEVIAELDKLANREVVSA